MNNSNSPNNPNIHFPDKKESPFQIDPTKVQFVELVKTLDVTSIEDAKSKISDIEVVGNGDLWQLLCKASSKSEGWMKSTKAMEIQDRYGNTYGCLVQVTTQQGNNVSESVTFIPCIHIAEDVNNGKKLQSGVKDV